MDFPGIDPDNEDLFRPYLQHLDKCHTFIFIIDVHRDHGVHGPTVDPFQFIAYTIYQNLTDSENVILMGVNGFIFAQLQIVHETVQPRLKTCACAFLL